MKIIVLGTRGFPNVQGGVESHCQNLYPNLVEKGHEVIVLARSPYVGKTAYEYKGVKVIPTWAPKSKFLEAYFHTILGVIKARRMGCDVLHIHAIGPGICVTDARILGMKVVFTHHGPDYQRKKWNKLAKFVLKFGEYLACKFSNRVIAISKNITEHVEEIFYRKAEFIPNGVIVEERVETDAILKKYGLEKGKYILTVGRFVPEKGFHDLIDAFSIAIGHRSQDVGNRKESTDSRWSMVHGQKNKVHSQGNVHSLQTIVHSEDIKDQSPKANSSELIANSSMKLVIVGGADHEDDYSRSLKEKAQNTSGVILTGVLKGIDLKEMYSHAGLFVLPSYYEGLPITLLEALSYGLNVIVSDIEANREVDLDDNRFFTPGMLTGMADKIKYFLNNPLNDEQKNKQIEMIRQRYNWEKIAERTEEVYNMVHRRSQ